MSFFDFSKIFGSNPTTSTSQSSSGVTAESIKKSLIANNSDTIISKISAFIGSNPQASIGDNKAIFVGHIEALKTVAAKEKLQAALGSKLPDVLSTLRTAGFPEFAGGGRRRKAKSCNRKMKRRQSRRNRF